MILRVYVCVFVYAVELAKKKIKHAWNYFRGEKNPIHLQNHKSSHFAWVNILIGQQNHC